MTFLAPIFLAAGAGVAGVIVLLHFLARRRPRPAILPTARFVPDRPARWPSRAPRPTDWLLLAARVLAVTAVAAGFAGPVRQHDRAIIQRIVLVDRSRAVDDLQTMRDSVLQVLREGDVLIPFDTSARIIALNGRDSAASLMRSGAPASLSAALIVAEHAAAILRDRADSLELTVVSPLAAEAWDHATRALRARWSGRARLIMVPLDQGDSSSRRIDVRAPRSDPVGAAGAPFATGGDARTRIVRTSPSAGDSVWARSRDHVLVHWPRSAANDSLTAEAVVGPDVVVVAQLVRWSVEARAARVLARFADGMPAIVEHASGEGCVRQVGFDLPPRGDVALRESVRRLVQLVAGPCDGREPRRALSVARMNSLRGSGALLATASLPRPPKDRSPATSWLLIAGALLLLVEVGLRRRVAQR